MSEKLSELHSLSRRYGSPYSVILLDIDHFKNFNDSLGHVQGDQALRELSRLLEASVRTLDFVYRYGGEEFLIVMPETDQESVRPESSTGPSVTVSVGHVSVTRHNIDRFAEWTDVVETADKALYRAKQSGRNRVEGPLEDA